jgi:hypothetical protein
MSKIDIFLAEIKRMKAIKKNGKFTITVEDIVLEYTLKDDQSQIHRAISKENIQSYTDNLSRLYKQSESSPNLDYSRSIQNFLEFFRRAEKLQQKLILYQQYFIFHFPIKILVGEMDQKYPSFISFFRDIIPMMLLIHNPNHILTFQMSSFQIYTFCIDLRSHHFLMIIRF